MHVPVDIYEGRWQQGVDRLQCARLSNEQTRAVVTMSIPTSEIQSLMLFTDPNAGMVRSASRG
jgi:hypothetical protein